MQIFFFYLFSVLAVLGAVGVVSFSKPTRALLSLVATMMSLSGLYVLLGASFVAMINLIVYAGAVLVLFLFVIMFQGLEAKDIPVRDRFPKPLTALIGAAWLGWLALLLHILYHGKGLGTVRGGSFGVDEVGRMLFTRYLLPFELISLLLILAIFAAVILAKQEPSK